MIFFFSRASNFFLVLLELAFKRPDFLALALVEFVFFISHLRKMEIIELNKEEKSQFVEKEMKMEK